MGVSWISQLPALASVPQARSDDFARFISTAVFRSARAVRHPGGQSIRCATVLSTEHAFFSQLPSPHIARTALYRAPFEQAKLVHCVQGRLFDVEVDISENSPTFRAWKSFHLAAFHAWQHLRRQPAGGRCCARCKPATPALGMCADAAL